MMPQSSAAGSSAAGSSAGAPGASGPSGPGPSGPGQAPPAATPANAPQARLRPLERFDDEARDAFVREHPRGTFFHLSGWRDCVARVFGHPAHEWCLERDGRWVGFLPCARTRSLRGRSSLVSIPYAVYGGPLAENSPDALRLVAAAQDLARAEGYGRVELRLFEDLPLDAPRSELYATFIAALPSTSTEILARMPKKARAEARKARERHGLVLREGPWYLDDLVRLFAANKLSLGSPSLPARWFKALLDAFPDTVKIHVVQRGSTPLAAVMSFCFQRQLLAYYAGTAPGADREFSASNYMYMALQEWAVERGFERFDFGRSRKDSGAFQFKQHQGFEAQDLPYRFLLVRDREPPSFHPSNPKTRRLREAWTRLPAPMASWMGARLSRYLP